MSTSSLVEHQKLKGLYVKTSVRFWTLRSVDLMWFRTSIKTFRFLISNLVEHR